MKHRIQLWFRIQGTKAHWYIGEFIYWLIKPVLLDRQNWIGKVIEDYTERLEEQEERLEHLKDCVRRLDPTDELGDEF